MTSPSEFSFAALLTYSPRGTSETSKKSRAIRDRVKRADPEALRSATKILRELVDEGEFEDFFDDRLLVPAPRSAPLVDGALWPGERIARAMLSAGIGSRLSPLLERTKAVPKAAFARPGERPTISDHLNTIAASAQEFEFAPRIIVVDDFITKGDVMGACISILSQAIPNSEVSGFALVRTMGLVPNVEALIDPCVGKLSVWPGFVDRRP